MAANGPSGLDGVAEELIEAQNRAFLDVPLMHEVIQLSRQHRLVLVHAVRENEAESLPRATAALVAIDDTNICGERVIARFKRGVPTVTEVSGSNEKSQQLLRNEKRVRAIDFVRAYRRIGAWAVCQDRRCYQQIAVP